MSRLAKHCIISIIIVLVFAPIAASGAETAASPQEPTIHLVGNAHIDLAYRWRWNETVDRVGPDTFEGVLRTMKQEPELTFAQSQLALYEAMEQQYPDLFRRIKEKIAEGKWSVVGGQWAEADAILPGGESLIRQFLIGEEYARTHLGVDSIKIAWVPDSFCGQALSIPKIYSGCGAKYYVFGRGAPEGKRVFWWESLDGSRILAYKIPAYYSVAVNRKIKQIAEKWADVADYQDVMILFGEGDHGGGPRENDIKNVRMLQQAADFPKILYDTPENYFQQLGRANKEWPVYKGEMGLGTGESGNNPGSWRGAYTSQARLKKANRDMENLLLTAEKFATIGSMLQRKPLFPRVDFREVWKVILRNQFHDVLPGTCIADAADDAMADYIWVKDEGERLLKFGLEVIGSRIDTRGEGIPLVVYNPVSWTRSDVVNASIRFVMPPDDFQIEDAIGNEVPFQVEEWSEDGLTAYVRFYAENVPALGYRLYRVFERTSRSIKTDLLIRDGSAANKYYRVRWNDTGITSIYDKKNDREILAGTGNVLKLLQEKRSSSWDLMLSGKEFPIQSVARARIVEEGDVELVVEWLNKTESSFFRRQMILKAGVPRVEFRMMVDWHEQDKILRVSFPTIVESGKAVFEQPYGYIERSADGTEWPAQNWVDLSGPDFGVALLNNGKYGFNVRKNTLNMSVVRGARDMDPRMDEGVHSFMYAITSHPGDFRVGDVTQKALELNQPMIAVQENKHIGNLPNWGNVHVSEFSLPSRYSFFGIESDHVIISAVKVQQGDWSPADVILRVYETEGRDDDVIVHLPADAKKIVETNHVEQPIAAKSEIEKGKKQFRFKIGHNQIRTFLITF